MGEGAAPAVRYGTAVGQATPVSVLGHAATLQNPTLVPTNPVSEPEVLRP